MLLFHQTLVNGQAFFWHDASLWFMPLLKAAPEAVREGYLPLWAPQFGCGFPLLAEGEAGVFYPVRALQYYSHLPYYQAYGWTVFIQCVVAALGCALLGRRLGLGYLAATFAGLAFGFSGYLVSKVLFLSVLQSLAWLPWVLLCLIAGLESGRWAWFVGAAMTLALAILGGHPQMVFYIVLAALLVMLWLLLVPGRVVWWRRLGRTLLGGLGALALGAGLAGIQLLPTLELARFAAVRATATAEFLRALACRPRNLLFFIHPYIFGSYGHNDYWGQDHWYEVCGYVGGITVLLAVVALCGRRWPLRHRVLWALLAAFGIFMALAELNPLYRFLPAAPGFNLFRAPGRYLILTTLGLALLAGGAVQALGGSHRRQAGRALACWGLIALLVNGGVVGLLHLQKPRVIRVLSAQAAALPAGGQETPTQKAEEKWQYLANRLGTGDPHWLAFLASLLLAAVIGLAVSRGWLSYAPAAAVLVAVLGVQLYLFARDANGYCPPSYYTEPPRTARLFHQDRAWGRQYTDHRIEMLQYIPEDYEGYLSGNLRPYYAEREVLRRNRATLWDVPTAHTYSSLVPQRETELLDELVPAGLAGEPQGAQASVQILRMLGVRALIAAPDLHSPWLQLVERNPAFAYYRVAAPMPRAWLPRRVRECGPPEALSALLRAEFLPEETAFVEGLDARQAQELSGDRGWARLVLDETTFLVWEVQTAKPGFLVLNQSYNPHWHVTVNGRPQPLYRANYLQGGTLVPAGKSTVCHYYSPYALSVGLRISAVSGLLALAWLLAALLAHPICRRRTRGEG
ncbi:MAG: YfhO family protein [candidate division WS1 bacterium]|nr:YfhO family protein [candidate division WS1 bacterium]